MDDRISVPDEKLFRYSFYKAGTVLFKQGDSSTEIYILKKGAVTVSVDSQIIGLINTPDTVIGEMAYFLGLDRTATIEAVEDSEFVVIPGEYLYTTVLKQPQIGINLLKLLSQRLARTTRYASRLEKDVIQFRNELRKAKGLEAEKKPAFEEELVRYGLLKPRQVEECKKELKKRQKKDKSSTLLKVLVDKGYISTQDLIHYLEQKQVSKS
ncbi:MAG: Crp/Fnr family transcriptional regulator [Spirochaetota bacterium]